MGVVVGGTVGVVVGGAVEVVVGVAVGVVFSEIGCSAALLEFADDEDDRG